MVNVMLRPLYPRERAGTHFTGGWLGSRPGLDGRGKKISPTRIRSPDRPVRSEFSCVLDSKINLLEPNINYSGRTAPLTSKVAFYIFIQQI